MTKKTGLFILGCVLLARLAVAAASSHPDLATADWSVNAPHSLAKDPPSNEAVWNFITHFWGKSWGGVGNLCSFGFANLRHSGELSLVAVYDAGGNAGCNDLSVFDKGPAGVEEYSDKGGLAATDIKEVVRDINSDGHFELVAPFGAASYCGQDWPIVYAWTGNGYTNVSSRYPRYYQNWLASLKQEITLQEERERLAQATPAPSAANGIVTTMPWQSGSSTAAPASVHPMQLQQPEAAPSASPEVDAASQLDVDCKLAQAAKIERFLGSKDAGMLDAIRWASSDDPQERMLAAQVFADMGTSEALKYEQTLSHDADPKVAKLASRKLRHWGEDDPYYAATFDRESPAN